MHPVFIIGAGPAGLATAAELTRRGVAYRLFERGPSEGTSWINAYDSLRLHTGRHLSGLPGLGYPRGTPLFPTRDEFVAYLHGYVRHFGLSVESARDVTALRREGEHWVARVGDEDIPGSAVIMATGIMSNPVWPAIEGREVFRGTVSHSVTYRNPQPFHGKRVLVIGVGNSGGEIAAELGNAGVDTTILVRRGANVVPRELAGVPIQYLAVAMKRLPHGARTRIARAVQKLSALRRGPPVLPLPPWTPADAVPVIGFHLVDAIKAGTVAVRLGTVRRFLADDVEFADGTRHAFDHVVCATGFAPALAPLGDLVRLDDRGFALRLDHVTSADQPDLWFVGMRYDTSGAIANIRADARTVGRQIARQRRRA